MGDFKFSFSPDIRPSGKSREIVLVAVSSGDMKHYNIDNNLMSSGWEENFVLTDISYKEFRRMNRKLFENAGVWLF